MWKRIRHALGTAVFVSVIIGTVLIYPMWQHHDVRAESPTFQSEAEARGWLQRFESEGAGAQCLTWARESQVINEAYSRAWFVTARCNTPRALGRVGIGYAVPFAIVLLLGFLLSSQRLRPTKKK